MKLNIDSPGAFLTAIYEELNIKFSINGTDLTVSEVFSPRGFLPLIAFYAIPRLRQYANVNIDIESEVQYTEDEDGIFGKSIFMPAEVLHKHPLFKYVLTQLSVDLLLDGVPLSYGVKANLDQIYEYFTTPLGDRETKEWKPRNL
jgi:hypothetical protein